MDLFENGCPLFGLGQGAASQHDETLHVFLLEPGHRKPQVLTAANQQCRNGLSKEAARHFRAFQVRQVPWLVVPLCPQVRSGGMCTSFWSATLLTCCQSRLEGWGKKGRLKVES